MFDSEWTGKCNLFIFTYQFLIIFFYFYQINMDIADKLVKIFPSLITLEIKNTNSDKDAIEFLYSNLKFIKNIYYINIKKNSDILNK